MGRETKVLHVIIPEPVKLYWKDVKIFLKPLNSNTTNIVKAIFTIPKEDIHKK